MKPRLGKKGVSNEATATDSEATTSWRGRVKTPSIPERETQATGPTKVEVCSSRRGAVTSSSVTPRTWKGREKGRHPLSIH